MEYVKVESTNKSRIFAREVARELSEADLNRVVGAGPSSCTGPYGSLHTDDGYLK